MADRTEDKVKYGCTVTGKYYIYYSPDISPDISAKLEFNALNSDVELHLRF